MASYCHGEKTETHLVVRGFELWAFALVRQVFSRLNHTSSPFCSGYFGGKVFLFARTSLDCEPPPSLGFLP
jgi:hypothetical protein